MRPPRPEYVAVGAISNIEIESDDWKEHRVGAIEEVTVLDRLDGEHGRQVRGSAPVPASAVADFWFHGVEGAHIAMITFGAEC
jgi:hypothetical protein